MNNTPQIFHPNRPLNKTLVDMFSQLPEVQGMFPEECPKGYSDFNGKEYGIYAGADRRRIMTDFTGDRVRNLKSLIAHMLKKADQYAAHQKSFSLSEATIRHIETNDKMPLVCKEQEILYESTRKESYRILKLEARDALSALYVLLLLDFCDLKENQKMLLIGFLSIRRESQLDISTPVEIIDANKSLNKFGLQEVYMAYQPHRHIEKLKDLHFKITKEGLGVHAYALHSSNLKPLDLPAEFEPQWAFRDFENQTSEKVRACL